VCVYVFVFCFNAETDLHYTTLYYGMLCCILLCLKLRCFNFCYVKGSSEMVVLKTYRFILSFTSRLHPSII